MALPVPYNASLAPARPAQPAVTPTLDTTQMILERRSEHTLETKRQIIYGLRGVANDRQGFSGATGNTNGIRADGKYADMQKTGWEEGRHNAIRVNTHLQAKSLVFNEPELKWRNCKITDPQDEDLLSKVRQAYYLQIWRNQRLMDAYRQKLLDMLIAGEGNMACWKLDDKLAVEYIDSLDITWDPAFKEPQRRRFAYIDRHMPISEALVMFPNLAKSVTMPDSNGRGGEKPCTITLYYSKSTYAVLYGANFVVPPSPNPYGRIPVRVTELFREQSMKMATGMVELQIGTHRLDLRLQRCFRELALRGIPVGFLKGPNWSNEQVENLKDAQEGTIIQNDSPSSSFEWVAGSEIPKTMLELKEMVDQQMNAESGTNDFQRGQTDTKVDFASQLAYIAQQSGVLGRYAAQQHEDGIREDAAMIMEIAALIEVGPIDLTIDGHDVTFDAMNPIKPLLGGDGDIILTPGGMEYKSPAQKIQEWSVLTQALLEASQLPPGIRERDMHETLKAFGVDDADQWIQDMVQAQQQMMAQQAQMAMMQAQPQGQPSGTGQAPSQGTPVGQGAPSRQAAPLGSPQTALGP